MLIVEHGDNPAADEPNNGPQSARRKDKGGVTFDVVAIIAALVLVVIGLANLGRRRFRVRRASGGDRGSGSRAAGGLLAVPRAHCSRPWAG